MKIDTENLITYDKYAELKSTKAKPLSRQRVQQLVNDGRLLSTEIGGKHFINKNAVIKPSKKKLGRPKMKAK